MNRKIKNLCILLATLVVASGCATTAPQAKQTGPRPPQNLIGSTDQLQLVTELSLDLARQYGAQNLLVVMGLDGTLLTPVENSDPSNHCAAADAADIAPLQADSAEQVQRILDASIPLVMVTKRSAGCKDKTRRQLEQFGFPLGTGPGTEALQFTDDAVFENGILFTAGQDKGSSLNQLLKKSGEQQPMLIVMVDAQQPNLSSVMKAFSSSNTKVHSWRYTRKAESAHTGP